MGQDQRLTLPSNKLLKVKLEGAKYVVKGNSHKFTQVEKGIRYQDSENSKFHRNGTIAER